MQQPGRLAEPSPAPSAATVRRWRQRLADEQLEAAVYRELAARRTGEERDILLALAEAEARHAAHWRELLGERGVGRRHASVRSRLLALLARRFGSVFVLALAQQAESRSPYEDDVDATPAMAADEKIHAEVVRGLAQRGRARISGTFRAAVFGANDGLVSNLALVLGVAGSGVATRTVLLTGLAGLLSGALSMGAGEFISVRSQRELLDASTPSEGHVDAYPHLDVDANELALVYRARGMAADEAQRHADEQLRAWPAVETTQGSGSGHGSGSGSDAELVGSGVAAAASSFCFFASGALVPVLPFLLGLTGTTALVTAVCLVGGALMLTGAVVGMLSGAPPLRRALRQLAVGMAAAGVTYALGSLFGATVG
jgi:VIT1/CCC1 family predicted Fe2+/Mn2+ transporter